MHIKNNVVRRFEPAPHATSMMPLLVGVTRRDHHRQEAANA